MAKTKLSDSFRISALIAKKLNGQLSAAEEAELGNWIAESPANLKLFNDVMDDGRRNLEMRKMSGFDADNAYQQVKARIDNGNPLQTKRLLTPLFYRFAAAAVLVLALGASWWFIAKKSSTDNSVNNIVSARPAKNKVTLTLANGKEIDVKAAKNGLIARLGSSAISKTADGRLNLNAGTATGAVQYNMLTVPRGERYEMTLPDGSRVWLNSESTLKFPVAFSAEQRLVELTGEAYFEVAHNRKQPFRVVANEQTVEVLGTHFNIEAYREDKRTITTLAQGSVSVTSGNNKQVIKPGQNALSTPNGQLVVAAADLDEALAWKNGLFSFKDQRVEVMMKEIARSYDVEVAYQGNVKDIKFWGTFPRAKGLHVLLKNLEQTNTIHFKLTGRRVLVMP